jgi:hypothetical protein
MTNTSSTGLSAGVVAGIVLGSLAGVGLLGAVVWFWMFREVRSDLGGSMRVRRKGFESLPTEDGLGAYAQGVQLQSEPMPRLNLRL